jgi:hypothetical protein
MATNTQNKPEDIWSKLRVTKENLRQSLEFFQARIKELNRSAYQPSKLLQSTTRLTIAPTPGRMLFFKYDAKFKDELPYWDSTPLIFFLHRHPDTSKSKTNFYGINIHYVPPNIRLNLLKALYTITNNNKFDATTKVNMSWAILKQLSDSKNLRIQACIKQYRFDHMQSRFLEIPPSSWPMVALLPYLVNFKKASAQKVYFDSRRK